MQGVYSVYLPKWNIMPGVYDGLSNALINNIYDELSKKLIDTIYASLATVASTEIASKELEPQLVNQTMTNQSVSLNAVNNNGSGNNNHFTNWLPAAVGGMMVLLTLGAIYTKSTNLDKEAQKSQEAYEKFRLALKDPDSNKMSQAILGIITILGIHEREQNSWSKEKIINTLEKMQKSNSDGLEVDSAKTIMEIIGNYQTKAPGVISREEMAILVNDITASTIRLRAGLQLANRGKYTPSTIQLMLGELNKYIEEHEPLSDDSRKGIWNQIKATAKDTEKLASLINDRKERQHDMSKFLAENKQIDHQIDNQIDMLIKQYRELKQVYDTAPKVSVGSAAGGAPAILHGGTSKVAGGSAVDATSDLESKTSILSYILDLLSHFLTSLLEYIEQYRAKNSYKTAMKNTNLSPQQREYAKEAFGSVMLGHNAPNQDKVEYADYYDKSGNYWLYRSKNQKDALENMKALEEKAIYRRCGETILGPKALDIDNIKYGENAAIIQSLKGDRSVKEVEIAKERQKIISKVVLHRVRYAFLKQQLIKCSNTKQKAEIVAEIKNIETEIKKDVSKEAGEKGINYMQETISPHNISSKFSTAIKQPTIRDSAMVVA